MIKRPNNPAPGKAGIGSRLSIEYHCPGLPEPGRSVAAQLGRPMCAGVRAIPF